MKLSTFFKTTLTDLISGLEKALIKSVMMSDEDLTLSIQINNSSGEFIVFQVDTSV